VAFVVIKLYRFVGLLSAEIGTIRARTPDPEIP
jgi:hypothetical protein